MPSYIHIFRTELSSQKGIDQLFSALDENPDISRWHLDLEDIDKVLKVETENLSEECIIALAREHSINCEALPD
jgi:hypothetical protein